MSRIPAGISTTMELRRLGRYLLAIFPIKNELQLGLTLPVRPGRFPYYLANPNW